MQLRGILLHPSLQAIARAAVAAVMHIAVKCVLASIVVAVAVAVELFFVFEFFSFVKHFSLFNCNTGCDSVKVMLYSSMNDITKDVSQTLDDVTDHEETRLKYILTIKDQLKTVFDPELPINIYDLGLIYDIKVTANAECYILHTLTSAFCPAADVIPVDIQNAVQSVTGIKKCIVRITMFPPWGPESLDPEIRQLILGW
jgi:metal-sulfur cluster biosynthetic enzyme